MRLVNLLNTKKVLDEIMETMEKLPSMSADEKEALKKSTKRFTVKHVLDRDFYQISRTKVIISSFLKQVENLGNTLIINVNENKECYDDESGWRHNFEEMYERSLKDRTPDVIEFEYDSKCNFGLQCTHIDVDGYGSLLPLTIANSLQAGSDGYQKYVFHIECPNGTSDDDILIGINLIKDIYEDEKGIPNPLLITDIPIEPETYSLLSDMGYKWVDHFTNEAMFGYSRGPFKNSDGTIANKCYMDWNYDVNEAMVIDHHPTNPFYVDYKKNGTPLPTGVYVCPTIGELQKLKGITIPEDLKFEVHAISEFDINELKISATYITDVILNPIVDELIEDDELYMNGDEDDYEDYRERYHRICRAISQWDTFEWRDHPECNDEELSPILFGNMGFDNQLSFEMERILNGIWDENTDVAIDCEDRDIINSVYLENMSDNNEFLKKVAQQLWFTAAFVSSENLGIDANKLNCPEVWAVTPFPTIGNASLVAHYMMVTDAYDLLKGDKTTGIIMYDPVSTTISFRTNETSVSVDKLAKFYNGGGHPQASGCKDPTFASSLKLYLQKIANFRKDTKNHPKMEIVEQ